MPTSPSPILRPSSSAARVAAACVATGAAMLVGAACIKRTAPPQSTGGTAAPGSAPVKTSAAQEAANARIAGIAHVDLLGGQSLGAFTVSGDARKVDMTTAPITGQPFNEALRLAVKDGSDHEWAVQLEAKNAAALDSGDSILTTFYVRSETPQQGSVGETELVFELAQSPYTKSIQYPIKVGGDWIKAQMRFKASRAFQPGEAHLLFRLGYEPQVLQLAGITFDSFGKQVPLSALPTTQASDRRRDKNLVAAATATATAALSGPSVEGGDLRLEVNATQVIRPISPYVYGINSQPGEGVGPTVRRMGGNRGTAYNWELDVSNAGNDYRHQSDDYSCTVMGYSNCSQPAAQYLEFAKSNRHAGWDSIATVPLVDWVTADKDGPVDEKDKAPSKRWVRSLPQKPTAYAAMPDLRDGTVYEDEFVNYMVQKLGKASDGGIKFYALDNEPAL